MAIPKFKFYLDGGEINPPVNWQSLQILATFDQSNIQANISTEEFEFVNEAAQQIRSYLVGGLTLVTKGIFDGLPFEIFVDNGLNQINVFSGYLDFSTYQEISPVRVRCKIKQSNGLNSLDDRSNANSFGYLEDQGFIVPSDYVNIDYVVEKLNIGSDLAIVTLALFSISAQIAKQFADIQKDQVTSTSIAASAPPVSLPAGLANLTATTIINVAYLALLIVQLIQLINELVNLLIPPLRTHKGMKLRRLMEVACNYLGYSYDSNLSELDTVVYLPSKPFNDEPILKGIPGSTDFGYRISEIFELINRLTNSKIVLKDGVLIQRSLNDPFWIKNATYQLPDVLDENIQFNNQDLNARTFLNFQIDLLDDWTIDNFTGTNYEVIVTPVIGEGSDTNLMKGLNEIAFPLALGNTKTDLNIVEKFFLEVFQVIDTILTPVIGLINVLGSLVGANPIQPPNFAGLITQRLNVLKVSQKNHSTAKLLFMEETSVGLRIPDNHRNEFSARVLWDKYHNYLSFVSNNFGGQRRIFTERVVPFGFSDFLACIDNSYFLTSDGKVGKIESIKWTLNDDKAVLDYWIEEVYTINLKESFIEA